MYSKRIPYDHRRFASEEVFVGRNGIVDWMVDGLRSGHSYGLVGEAGIGKTSLLFALKRELTHRWYRETEPVSIPVFIELNARLLTHEGAIFAAILSNFIAVLTKQHGLVVSTRETLLEEARQGRLEEALHALSDQYYKQHHRLCRLVLLVDDLHRGLDHQALKEAVSVLRPLVSPKDTALNVALVLAGELPLEQEFRNDVSSLRGLLSDTLRLAPLLPNDVATLIGLAEDAGWPVEQGCAEVAFTITGGSPFKLHYYLFTALDRYRRISQSILQKLSQDQHVQNYLDTVLKQTSARTKGTGKTTMPTKGKVFISYSHKDVTWLERLQVHLAPIRRRGLIELWDDTKITGGSKWQEEIEKAIEASTIAVVLVSADFMASEFISKYELPQLLSRAESGGTTILPVIIAPSLFEDSGLDVFQTINPPSKPLISMAASEQEETLVKLAKTIKNKLL